MRLIYLGLALLPLAWAANPRDARPAWSWDFQGDRQYDCATEKLAKGECENARALRRAGPLDPKPILKCSNIAPLLNRQNYNSPRPIYAAAAAAATTLKKTKKHPGPPNPTNSRAATPPRPPPSPPPKPQPTKSQPNPQPTTTSKPPTLKGPPPSTSPIPKSTNIPPSPSPSPSPSILRCGSLNLAPCPLDETCINDPFDLDCLTAFDCPGYCVRLNDSICGPVFGIACPSDAQLCVNDPRDDDCTTRECPGTCVVLDRGEEVGVA